MSDADARTRRRERDQARRADVDLQFQARLAEQIKRLFPGFPAGRATAIAEHTGLRGSGRVGRSAAGRAFDETAITLAVVASVRHVDTDYDSLLMAGLPATWPARGADLSQVELAHRAGVTQSVISAYESGHRQPSLRTLAALVEAADYELVVDVRRRPHGLSRLSGPIGRRLLHRRQDVISAAAAHGVSGLRVFGSVARGEDRADSDVDLLVDLPQHMSLFGLGRLQAELESILGARVDLVPSQDLKPDVRLHADRDLVKL